MLSEKSPSPCPGSFFTCDLPIAPPDDTPSTERLWPPPAAAPDACELPARSPLPPLPRLPWLPLCFALLFPDPLAFLSAFAFGSARNEFDSPPCAALGSHSPPSSEMSGRPTKASPPPPVSRRSRNWSSLRDPEVAPAPASCSSVKTPTGRRSWLPAMLFILWMDTSHSWHRYALSCAQNTTACLGLPSHISHRCTLWCRHVNLFVL
mmetsp:Transcript_13170/g.36102  ORF Transcript_13170/g.36102 Transcript_13170/m.36102 type:complete len:207 (+) Transcript_13170:1031-1651(+)